MDNCHDNDMKMIGRPLTVYPEGAKRPLDRLVIQPMPGQQPEDLVFTMLCRLAGIGYAEPNLVDVISASCGWHPLERDRKMTVQYAGKKYVITRAA